MQRSNTRLSLYLGGLAIGMVGLSFAAVPLYQIFCQVTGFGGTPQIVDQSDVEILDRGVTVTFNADTERTLAWGFEPVQRSMKLKLGEQALAFYQAVNNGDEPITGTAVFNVTPLKVGQYFNKIECFCFTEQTLQPGEAVDMPVTFYVDPRLNDDPSMQDVTTITLSYTFYRAEVETPPSQDTALLTQPSNNRD